MLIIDGAPSVVIPRSDFHDRPACSIASHSCSNTSLAVVRPCIVFTQSNSSVTSNWLLTPRKLETFAFDAQLDLFSDKDRRTIHYLAYYSVTGQNDRRHSSKIPIFNDFVAISWLPLRKNCSSRKCEATHLLTSSFNDFQLR